MTFTIAVPTGIKFFNWIGTMWKGQLTFESPMRSPSAPLVVFPLRRSVGRAAGQPAAGLPRQRHLFRRRPLPLRAVRRDRVRHLCRHLLLVPKMTGRLLDERVGWRHFWLTMIGFNTTFLVQHWLR